MQNKQEKEILELYQNLTLLGIEEKKWIHYKSISNIIYHLISNNKINSKKNKKLQELGEIRMKKLLVDFLKDIQEKKPNNVEDSLDVYKKYINPIGTFMSRYYRFSNFAGKSIVTYFFIVVTIAAILSFFIILIFKSRLLYIIFFSFIVLFSIIRIVLKYKKKRIYGFLY